MVFSAEDKAVIKHYHEKGFTPYRIWKQNPEKGWDKTSVKRLIKRFEKFATMERQRGSGRPRTAVTDENEESVDDLICSQENEPGSHIHPRDIAKKLSISHSSVRRIIKAKNINQFKRLKTPCMNDNTRKRRVERASNLLEQFEKKPRMIERAVFQDESDFPLQIPINCQNNRVYYKGQKKDVPDKNIYHKSNRHSVKVMVSAALTWHGVTMPLFVGKKGIKVNAENYCKHLKKKYTHEKIGFLSKMVHLHIRVILSKIFYRKPCHVVTLKKMNGLRTLQTVTH